MSRVYHMAKLISETGVSALCYSKPRPINMRIATWTNRREAVTCKACLLRLKRVSDAAAIYVSSEEGSWP